MALEDYLDAVDMLAATGRAVPADKWVEAITRRADEATFDVLM